MAHLLNVWPSVSSRLRREERVLLLFDYDGTLTPIVARPEDAVLDAGVRELLKALASQERYVVGMVSGRGLKDLEERAAVPGLVYAGNHGLEIRGPGLDFVHPGAAAAEDALRQVKAVLEEELGDVPGAQVEHKGLSLTVHYRNVPAELAGMVERTAVAAAAPFVERGELKTTRGKMVVEVRPGVDWDKGRAIAMIRESFPDAPYPVYFGDDRTDEDGFKVVQDLNGLAVFVGTPRDGTTALHQLESPAEVAHVLQMLLAL